MIDEGLSIATSCRCVGLSRSNWYRVPDDWTVRDAEIIAALALQPPPEGGHYAETWRAPTVAGQRPAGTAIYYLLEPHTFSALHRLAGDEVYHVELLESMWRDHDLRIADNIDPVVFELAEDYFNFKSNGEKSCRPCIRKTCKPEIFRGKW